jgi:hypothetical protein
VSPPAGSAIGIDQISLPPSRETQLNIRFNPAAKKHAIAAAFIYNTEKLVWFKSHEHLCGADH